jgi:hypothetical protein
VIDQERLKKMGQRAVADDLVFGDVAKAYGHKRPCILRDADGNESHFDSIAEAARATDTPYSTVVSAIYDGRVIRAGRFFYSDMPEQWQPRSRASANFTPIQIGELKFASMRDAARHLNCRYHTIWHAAERGHLNGVPVKAEGWPEKPMPPPRVQVVSSAVGNSVATSAASSICDCFCDNRSTHGGFHVPIR